MAGFGRNFRTRPGLEQDFFIWARVLKSSKIRKPKWKSKPKSLKTQMKIATQKLENPNENSNTKIRKPEFQFGFAIKFLLGFKIGFWFKLGYGFTIEFGLQSKFGFLFGYRLKIVFIFFFGFQFLFLFSDC